MRHTHSLARRYLLLVVRGGHCGPCECNFAQLLNTVDLLAWRCRAATIDQEQESIGQPSAGVAPDLVAHIRARSPDFAACSPKIGPSSTGIASNLADAGPELVGISMGLPAFGRVRGNSTEIGRISARYFDRSRGLWCHSGAVRAAQRQRVWPAICVVCASAHG